MQQTSGLGNKPGIEYVVGARVGLHIYGTKLLPAAHAIYTPGKLELASIDKSGIHDVHQTGFT